MRRIPNPRPAVTRRRVVLGLITVLAGVAGMSQAGAAESAPPFRVIVHPNNSLSSLSRDFISDIFLKRATRWADGEAIRPVDLRPDSATRRVFSEQVLKRSVAAVRSYWQQRIFSGRGVPPPELDSDEKVVDYVANNPQAIGYISGASALGATKEVVVR